MFCSAMEETVLKSLLLIVFLGATDYAMLHVSVFRPQSSPSFLPLNNLQKSHQTVQPSYTEEFSHLVLCPTDGTAVGH